jgi:hypothetical protein
MLDSTHSTMANVVEAYLFRDPTQVASEVFMIRREKHKLDKALGSAVSTVSRLTGLIERILVSYAMPPGTLVCPFLGFLIYPYILYNVQRLWIDATNSQQSAALLSSV